MPTTESIQRRCCSLSLKVFKASILVECYSLTDNHSDGILISRNVGGRVAPALQEIMLFDAFLKLTNVVVIHHTGSLCIFQSQEIKADPTSLQTVVPAISRRMPFAKCTRADYLTIQKLITWCSGLSTSKQIRSGGNLLSLKASSDSKNSLEQSVRDDLQVLKTSPYIPRELADRSSGFVFDIKTGLLSQVE